MKIRTPDCECIICEDNGKPIVRSIGPSTYHAIKRMRQLFDGLIAERDAKEATTCDSSTGEASTPTP